MEARNHPDLEGVLPLLNPRARQVIYDAGRFSRRYGDSYVGSEHLLLAIAQHENGMGWSFLDNAGCAESVRTAIEQFLAYQAERRAKGEDQGA